MDEQMIEQIARAIEHWEFPSDPWEKCHPSSQDMYREMARAAHSVMAGKVAELTEALEEIANPLAAMKRRAEAEGNRLSGMANQIANDPEQLKRIARAALAPHPKGME